MGKILKTVYRRLEARFGPQHWWPAETPFEVMVGAVLTQNTNWQNVSRAIENLRDAGLLEPHALLAVEEEQLSELIRPAGYFRVKARRLRNLVAWLVQRHDGDLEAAFAGATDAVREELLSINGVGPETADSILLYAGGHPIFVVDAYTARVLTRHGWIEPEADYRRLQEYFHDHLEREVPLYNEYHALLVRLGKEYCRKRPKCDGCPLADLLVDGRPLLK